MAASPDATCSALTSSGSSCQAPAVIVLQGLPFCHRKSHQKQAKALAGDGTGAAADRNAAGTPEPVAASVAPVPEPPKKKAPKLKVVKGPACLDCGGTATEVGTYDAGDAPMKLYCCKECGAGFQLPA